MKQPLISKKAFVILMMGLIIYLPACTSVSKQHKKEQAIRQIREERLEWFCDQRYGMFIHWGPSVIHGGRYDSSELSWSRGGNPPDTWCSGGSIPEAIYDNSFRSFDPVKYDPKTWVQLAKDAGMRYMVMTARHHDGFSMFDTQFSDFKITHPEGAYRQRIAKENPNLTNEEINRKADIIRQFADAVHAAGMGLGFYYSEPDWIREDYRIALTGKDGEDKDVCEEERQAAEKSYQDFMHAQLEELTTQYGRVDILWLDAIKPSQVAEHGWDALWIRRDTWDMVRRNQPGILINDRHGFEPDYRTPEGSDAQYIPGVVQESCQHLGRQWQWWPNDRVPSLKWVIDRLVINASRNSNVLMNLGPSPEGVFDPKQAALMRQAGQWLDKSAAADKHGQAFYGTRGGPVINNEKDPPFVMMHKDDRIYVHVLHSDLAGGEIHLPGIKITSAYLFDRPGQPLKFRHDKDAAYVRLPETIDPIDEIITISGSFDRSE
ncbi:MAG: alpha-L-fucosidase [Sedimentisphaerales bacterium]|nr:alpha-L-fucosidase [Sedimentisphaerales bacterium]